MQVTDRPDVISQLQSHRSCRWGRLGGSAADKGSAASGIRSDEASPGWLDSAFELHVWSLPVLLLSPFVDQKGCQEATVQQNNCNYPGSIQLLEFTAMSCVEPSRMGSMRPQALPPLREDV